MANRIKSYRDLRVYQNAMDAAMEIFEITKKFPVEEKYSLIVKMIDQPDKWIIRKSINR